ncbi:MarR family transcriptional regulator [Patescibacteria group bacterium]|nr:MarR family transcriptional regulator [Patescibacteria group bacterium]
MLSSPEVISQLIEGFFLIRRKLTDGLASSTTHITPSQGWVLSLVDKQGPMSVKTIAQKLRMSSSAATQLIDALVQNGYLIRSEDEADRRTSLISATEKGKETIQVILNHLHISTKQTFGVLTPEELDTYITLTEKIVRTLHEPGPKD